MTARRLSELTKAERRRAWMRTAAALAVVWIALAGVYYLVPAGGVPASSSRGGSILRLVVGIALFAVPGRAGTPDRRI